MGDIKSRKEERKRKKQIRRAITCAVLLVVVIVGGKLIASKVLNTDKLTAGATTNTSSSKVNITKPKTEPPKPNPTDIVKGSNVTYEGEKYAIAASDVAKMVKNEYQGEGKRVFLTFDDGPSTKNTPTVLAALKEKGVHGTFFVLGQMLEKEEGKKLLKETIEAGNSIGNHSYTHNLKTLYPNRKVNVETFMKEYDQTNNLMKQVLGDDFDTKVLRLPGGYMSRVHYKDANLPEFDKTLADRGIVSIDWNALDGDAEGKPYTEEKMMEYVKNSSKDLNNVIILMHDTYGKQKEKTAAILPQIIDYFKANGYEFKTIKND